MLRFLAALFVADEPYEVPKDSLTR